MYIRTKQTVYFFFFSMLISILLKQGILYAGDTYVNTPEGRPVPADTPQEMTPEQIEWCHDHIQTNYLDPPLSLNAVRIGDASNTYNCHGYAWSLSEGGQTVWIGL